MTLQVIDWKEALQQCGEDEDFLKELMLDLKSESGKQIAAMEEIIRVRNAVTIVMMRGREQRLCHQLLKLAHFFLSKSNWTWSQCVVVLY